MQYSAIKGDALLAGQRSSRRPVRRSRRAAVVAAAVKNDEPRSFRSLFGDIVRNMNKSPNPGYGQGTLASATAQVLKAQGKMAEAEPLLKQAVPTLVTRLGDSDPETLSVVLSLAALLQSQGKREDLEPILRDILPRAKNSARGDQDETLRALNAAAKQLLKEGKIDDAEAALRDVLGNRLHATGTSRPTLRSMAARLLEKAGRPWASAAPPPVLSPPGSAPARKGLLMSPFPIPAPSAAPAAAKPAAAPAPASASASASSAPLPEDPFALNPRIFSASLSLEQKPLPPPQRRSLLSASGASTSGGAAGDSAADAPILARVQTEPFVSAATPMVATEEGSEWAGALGGPTEDALLRRALQSTADVRSGKFKDMNGLAAYIANKSPEERAVAAPLYRKALAESRAKLGPRHPDTITFTIGLAACLKDSAEFGESATAEAEQLFREGLEGIRMTVGDFHPDTLIALVNLSKCLMFRGDLPEAERYCRAALSLSRELLGDNNKTTLASLNSLAIVLYAMGNEAEAEALLKESGRIKTNAQFAYYAR